MISYCYGNYKGLNGIFYKSIVNTLESFTSYEDRQVYLNSIMPDATNVTCKCPKCKAPSSKMHYHGKYTRNISFLLNHEVQNFKVTVTRVRCDSCGTTHAILPSFIVPYKIMALNGILLIVKGSIASVLKFANKVNLSFQLVYCYIACFLSFFNDVSIFNNSKNLCKNFNKRYFLDNALSFDNQDFLIGFFDYYQWLFLMSKFRNVSSRSIYIGYCKGAFT